MAKAMAKKPTPKAKGGKKPAGKASAGSNS